MWFYILSWTYPEKISLLPAISRLEALWSNALKQLCTTHIHIRSPFWRKYPAILCILLCGCFFFPQYFFCILRGDSFFYFRWSKDVRSRENAARSRSKVAAKNLPPQVPANQQTSQVVQLPSRVAANQPTSIFEENDQEFSSSPKTEEVRKPKRRIAYGWSLYKLI